MLCRGLKNEMVGGHRVYANRLADLPDELAQRFIALGAVEPVGAGPLSGMAAAPVNTPPGGRRLVKLPGNPTA